MNHKILYFLWTNLFCCPFYIILLQVLTSLIFFNESVSIIYIFINHYFDYHFVSHQHPRMQPLNKLYYHYTLYPEITNSHTVKKSVSWFLKKKLIWIFVHKWHSTIYPVCGSIVHNLLALWKFKNIRLSFQHFYFRVN